MCTFIYMLFKKKLKLSFRNHLFFTISSSDEYKSANLNRVHVLKYVVIIYICKLNAWIRYCSEIVLIEEF